MDLSPEILDIMVPTILLAGAVALVGYLTKGSRDFRSSRNKRARKQSNL